MDFYKDKKVLVAGGTGLIGTPLTRMLLDEGAHVRVASLDPPERANPRSEFYQVDLSDLRNATKVCQGIDYVFNLMCFKGSIKTIREKPVNFMVYTILPSMQLTRAAHEQGIEKFLYTSTLGVYGPAQVWNEDDVLDENNVLLNPPKVYAFGAYPKLFGELEARAYNEQHGWDISIVRPASVYGPGDNFDPGNAMVIASLTGQAMEGVNPLQVWGDGSEVRDFVHAEDVARGMMLVLEKSPGPYKPVNLGGGKETTIKELAETIARTTPNKPKIDWDTTKPTGDKRRFLDISRARSLGWEPQISLEQGIEDLVTWYGQNRDKIKRKDDLL